MITEEQLRIANDLKKQIEFVGKARADLTATEAKLPLSVRICAKGGYAIGEVDKLLKNPRYRKVQEIAATIVMNEVHTHLEDLESALAEIIKPKQK